MPDYFPTTCEPLLYHDGAGSVLAPLPLLIPHALDLDNLVEGESGWAIVWNFHDPSASLELWERWLAQNARAA